MTELTSKQAISWRDFYEMCKPRVVMLMLLTSLVGMFLAVPGMVPLDILVLGNLGIGLVAGSGAMNAPPSGTVPMLSARFCT